MIDPTNMIGQHLGGYQIEALIGSGGMASVYRGFDPKLQRHVAIKVLAAAIAAQPGFADRFRQEARLIANLRHPNIVQVYDFGQADGQSFMVQELLPGPTLEQRLLDAAAQGTALPRDEIVAIITQLAGALDAAHAAGIIHRDVKPGNALWNGYGALVLTDFGIAKDTQASIGHTQVGLVVGTPAYLSPEQAEGLPLTAASDIYALGVVLYQLISGKLPFDSTTPMRVVLSHVHDTPPPLLPLRPDLPPAAEAVVLRALEKDPTRRFASAGELAQALAIAWLPQPQPATAAPGIHQQATQIWGQPQRHGPVEQRTANTEHRTHNNPPGGFAPAAPMAPRAGVPPMRQPARAVPVRLLVLGTLLVLMLLGGALLALGGTPRRPATVTQPTSAPRATNPPAATAIPPPGGQPPANEPIAQLRNLLEQGSADKQITKDSAALRASLDAAEQALAQGNTRDATLQLGRLQKQVLAGARNRTLTPTFMRQALSGIDTIARRHNLKLALTVGG